MKKFIIFALFFVFVLNEETEENFNLSYNGNNKENCMSVEVPSEKN